MTTLDGGNLIGKTKDKHKENDKDLDKKKKTDTKTASLLPEGERERVS